MSYPAAPHLRGETILDVFTHRSLRLPGAQMDEDSEFGDNERLAVLGEKVLELAVTFALFNKRPMLKADEIDMQRSDALSDEKVESWVVAYKMREKLRCSPDAASSLRTPKETRFLFNSYVGAVFAQNGIEVVQNWIGQLVGAASPPPPDVPPPVQPPPSPPMPIPATNGPAPGQLPAFLPVFNQTAAQRRLDVQYPASFTGPAHDGRWAVQCIVDGAVKGESTGMKSKQLAKEEAARQAYYAMGWAPRA